MKTVITEVERVRAPAPPAGTPWPWPEDRDQTPARTVERLVVDEPASIQKARDAGREQVLYEDIVHVAIDVPVLGPSDYDGPRTGMVAELVVPVVEYEGDLVAAIHGDQLEHELWDAGIGVIVSTVYRDGKQVLRLGAPGPFDEDAARRIVAAHKTDDKGRWVPTIKGGMGYADPQTVHNPSVGGIATAAWGDTVRDDLEFLVAPPQCSFSHSTTTTVNDSTWTSLAGNTEAYDTDTMHNTVTNNSRATIVTPGKYTLIAIEEVAANATGYRAMRFLVNSVTQYELHNMLSIGGVPTSRLNGARTLPLVAADFVETQAWQNSGGARAVQLIEMSAQFTSR